MLNGLHLYLKISRRGDGRDKRERALMHRIQNFEIEKSTRCAAKWENESGSTMIGATNINK